MPHFENIKAASPAVVMAAGVCALNSLIKYVASLVPLYVTFVEENNHVNCILLI